MFIPRIAENFFHEDIMYLIKKEIEHLKTLTAQDGIELDENFQRIGFPNDPFLRELHHMITGRFSMMIGENVQPSYCYTSMYFKGKGICPEHTDRPQCVYTLDLCVNQNEPWPINVAGADYILNEGDALIYSGTGHRHYRERIQPDNYCDLLFFHFVPLDFKGPLF
jgi:hypothetical protein